MLERVSRPWRGLWNGIAGAMDAIFGALGAPGKLLQDFLNGTWLGHSLHAALVDVVVGAATAAVLLDVLRVFFGVEGLETATIWVVGLGVVSAVASIVTGLTDFKDTGPGGAERDVTGLHGLTNIVATALLAVSLFQRVGGSHDAAFWALALGYVVLSIGAFIGGHVVYKYGYMVNHNAFNRGKRATDFTPLTPLQEVPEGTPTKLMFGSTAVVVIRRGDVVHTLKETCSHAAGPLSEGELKDDTITCPWHGSTFRLPDGSVVHGPAHSRQPSYRARVNAGMIELQGPHD